jgi:hypothetical protein
MDRKTRSFLPGTTGLGDDRLSLLPLCLSTDPENSVALRPGMIDRYLSYCGDLELGRIDSALMAFSIGPSEQ